MIPEVSVIIPTYNNADVISESIESVLNQIFDNFELIIVDDGSTDQTESIVKSFSDLRIRYIWQPNQERSAARNNGINASHAPFITFLDADDCFLPHKLACQVSMLQKTPNIGMVLSGWNDIDAHGKLLLVQRPWLKTPNPTPRDWFFSKLTIVGAHLIRRDWLTRLNGFDTNLTAAEDTDLWLRLAAAGCQARWVKEIVMQRRRHNSNTINDAKRMRDALLKVIDKNFVDPAFVSASKVSEEEAYTRAYLSGAFRQYVAGCMKEAQTDLENAIKYDPSLATHRIDQIVKRIVNYANDPLVEDPVIFTQRVLNNLPDSLSHLCANESPILAKVWETKAYSAYQVGDFQMVRQTFPQIIRRDLSLLKNRGLVSLWLKSLFKSSPKQGTRQPSNLPEDA